MKIFQFGQMVARWFWNYYWICLWNKNDTNNHSNSNPVQFLVFVVSGKNTRIVRIQCRSHCQWAGCSVDVRKAGNFYLPKSNGQYQHCYCLGNKLQYPYFPNCNNFFLVQEQHNPVIIIRGLSLFRNNRFISSSIKPHISDECYVILKLSLKLMFVLIGSYT